MSERPQINREEILSSGPPTEWYAGYGRTDTGIHGVHVSAVFMQLADGQATRHYGDYSHFRASLLPGISERRRQQLNRTLNTADAELRRLTGFSAEEIAGKKSALLDLYQGETSAPFLTYLAEPFEVPETEPPLTWFRGFASQERGILRVTYGEELTGMENGEVGRQLIQWDHYYGNYTVLGDKASLDQQAMETISYASHLVRAVTGYYPDNLMRILQGLQEAYKGEEDAPFEVEYID